MAISFLNLGALGSSGNAITLGQPATPAVNDIWIMVIQTANQAIATPTNATAGTWAEIAAQTGTGTAATAGSVMLGFYWHRWTTTTGNITVADSGNHQIARIAAYRGCKTSGDPWNAVTAMASGTYNSSTNIRGADITTTVDNCRLLHAVAHAWDVADQSCLTCQANSPLSSAATRINNSLATGTGGGIFLGEALMATADTITGATEGFTELPNGSTPNPTNYIDCTVALEPVVSATSIKTVDGLAQASVKTVNGLAIASVKTVEGLA